MPTISWLRTKLLAGFMALSPIFYYGSGNLRDTQCKFYQFGSIVVVSSFIENIWLVLFIYWNMFLFFYNGGIVGLNQVLNVFLGCLLFQVSKQYFSKHSFYSVAKVLLWIGVLTIVWMIFQGFAIDPLYIGQRNDNTAIFGRKYTQMNGLLSIKMANATFLSCLIPILAYFNIYIAMILFIPLIISESSMVMLAAYISTLFYTFYNKRKLFLILLMLGTIGTGVFIFKDQKHDPKTFKSRFGLWHCVFHYCLVNPVGYGPDSFRNTNSHKDFRFISDDNYHSGIETENSSSHTITYIGWNPHMGLQEKLTPVYYDTVNGVDRYSMNKWDEAHNEYLQFLFEYGIVGFAILIAFCRDLLLRFWYSTKSQEVTAISAILIIYFVSSLAHFPLHLARLGFLFPITVGAFFAKTEDYA